METTLHLDDELVHAAEKRAADRGLTLERLVEEALREALREEQRASPGPFKSQWVTVEGRSVPEVDLSDRSALLDRMEGRS